VELMAELALVLLAALALLFSWSAVATDVALALPPLTELDIIDLFWVWLSDESIAASGVGAVSGELAAKMLILMDYFN
jgi:hypothetical protein